MLIHVSPPFFCRLQVSDLTAIGFLSTLPDNPLADRSNKRRPARLHAEQYGNDDEHANERALPVRIDAGHQKRVANYLEESRADHRAEGGSIAAHQVGAADDRAGDHTEL